MRERKAMGAWLRGARTAPEAAPDAEGAPKNPPGTIDAGAGRGREMRAPADMNAWLRSPIINNDR